MTYGPPAEVGTGGTPAAGADPEEAGLARERTVLAWNRSGLAVVVCIAAVLRHLWPLRGAGEAVALGAVAGAGMIWAAVLVLSSLSASSAGRRRPPAGERYFAVISIGTVSLAVGALVLAVVAAP